MSFSALPAEIHLNISFFLDYVSLIELQATSHYLNGLSLTQQKRAALFELEQQAPGTPNPDPFTRRLIRHTHLPCYTCLKFLSPETHFEPGQIVGRRALGQSGAVKRKCGRCTLHRKGKVLQESELSVNRGIFWISCVACHETKRYVSQNLHEHAWARGQLCMECWWFKITPYVADDELGQFWQYDGVRMVRVPDMDGQTAAMLMGEVARRTLERNTAEYKALLGAIRRAAKMPNIAISPPETGDSQRRSIRAPVMQAVNSQTPNENARAAPSLATQAGPTSDTVLGTTSQSQQNGQTKNKLAVHPLLSPSTPSNKCHRPIADLAENSNDTDGHNWPLIPPGKRVRLTLKRKLRRGSSEPTAAES